MDHPQLLAPGQPGEVVFWQPVDDWTGLKGLTIEVHQRGFVMDRGIVDAVTPDGLVLWLAFEGAVERRIVEKAAGVYARVLP
ncbi:hypothetical protein AB0N65_10690 [Paenarthrobacter sp. NPDC089322]|uniref:hypothetical protein n=1 Tax=Paenarthrobacter sp. NPDC089322 TaxID=3155065 RepID=UPI003417A78C